MWKSTEFEITKWCKEGTWLHSFDFSIVRLALRNVHKERQHFLGRKISKIAEKVITDRYKKVMTWGRGVSKIAKKVQTYFMDDPFWFVCNMSHPFNWSFTKKIIYVILFKKKRILFSRKTQLLISTNYLLHQVIPVFVHEWGLLFNRHINWRQTLLALVYI